MSQPVDDDGREADTVPIRIKRRIARVCDLCQMGDLDKASWARGRLPWARR